MKIENKLALVWRNDEINLAFPLDKVNTDLYKKLSKIFGRPVGRIEPFINSGKYNKPNAGVWLNKAKLPYFFVKNKHLIFLSCSRASSFLKSATIHKFLIIQTILTINCYFPAISWDVSSIRRDPRVNWTPI